MQCIYLGSPRQDRRAQNKASVAVLSCIVAGLVVAHDGASQTSLRTAVPPPGCNIECIEFLHQTNGPSTLEIAAQSHFFDEPTLEVNTVEAQLAKLAEQYEVTDARYELGKNTAAAFTIVGGFAGDLSLFSGPGAPLGKFAGATASYVGYLATEKIEEARDAAVYDLVSNVVNRIRSDKRVDFDLNVRVDAPIEEVREWVFGTNNAYWDNERLDKLKPEDRNAVRDVKDDVLRDAITDVTQQTLRNTRDIDQLQTDVSALQKNMVDLNEAVRKQQQYVQELDQNLKATQEVFSRAIITNASDIELTQRVLFGQLSASEQKAALNSGFFRSMSQEDRSVLIEQLEQRERIERSVANTKAFAGYLYGAASIIGASDPELADKLNRAGQAVDGVSQMIAAAGSSNPVGVFMGFMSVTGAFGKRSDPEQARYERIMQELRILAQEMQAMRRELSAFREETNRWFVSTQEQMRALHNAEMVKLSEIQQALKRTELIVSYQLEPDCPDAILERQARANAEFFGLLSNQILDDCVRSIGNTLPRVSSLNGTYAAPFMYRPLASDVTPELVAQFRGSPTTAEVEVAILRLTRQYVATLDYVLQRLTPERQRSLHRDIYAPVSFRTLAEIHATESPSGVPPLDNMTVPIAYTRVEQRALQVMNLSRALSVSRTSPLGTQVTIDRGSLLDQSFSTPREAAEYLQRADLIASISLAQQRLMTGVLFEDELISGIDAAIAAKPVVLDALRLDRESREANCASDFQNATTKPSFAVDWQLCSVEEHGMHTMCVMEANPVLASNAVATWTRSRLTRTSKPSHDPGIETGKRSIEEYEAALKRSEAYSLQALLGGDAKFVRKSHPSTAPQWFIRLPKYYTVDTAVAEKETEEPTACFADHALPDAQRLAAEIVVQTPDFHRLQVLRAAIARQRARTASLSDLSNDERRALSLVAAHALAATGESQIGGPGVSPE